MNVMTYEEMLTLARNTLGESPALHDEPLPKENEGLYVCEPVKGGRALMIAPDGSMLFADSSIGFEEHLEAFRQGLRTPPDDDQDE